MCLYEGMCKKIDRFRNIMQLHIRMSQAELITALHAGGTLLSLMACEHSLPPQLPDWTSGASNEQQARDH